MKVGLTKIILNKIHTSQVPKKLDYALRNKVFCLRISSLFIYVYTVFFQLSEKQ